MFLCSRLRSLLLVLVAVVLPAVPATAQSSANPFNYDTQNDQYLACAGIAARDSSPCSGISDANDRQMCYGMSTGTQSPCTSMTDRNLQLACYGMSVAPNYPSNCRDITDPGLQDFCYSVSSWGTWANCQGVDNGADKALCQALTYRNSAYCANITAFIDRSFCYAVTTHNYSYCQPPPSSCDPAAEQDCYNQGGSWNPDSCACRLPHTCDSREEAYCSYWGGIWDPDACSCNL